MIELTFVPTRLVAVHSAKGMSWTVELVATSKGFRASIHESRTGAPSERLVTRLSRKRYEEAKAAALEALQSCVENCLGEHPCAVCGCVTRVYDWPPEAILCSSCKSKEAQR